MNVTNTLVSNSISSLANNSLTSINSVIGGYSWLGFLLSLSPFILLLVGIILLKYGSRLASTLIKILGFILVFYGLLELIKLL